MAWSRGDELIDISGLANRSRSQGSTPIVEQPDRIMAMMAIIVKSQIPVGSNIT